MTDRPIVLVGFMAAGKSKIGSLLANRLRLPFVDVDAAIETEFGQSVAQIFAEHGEQAFRAAEQRTIARLTETSPQVLAAGGGAFVDSGTRDLLKQRARTVWLDPPFDLILARLSRSTNRPLANNSSEGELHQLWLERRPLYAQADLRVETTDADPLVTVAQIASLLNG